MIRWFLALFTRGTPTDLVFVSFQLVLSAVAVGMSLTITGGESAVRIHGVANLTLVGLMIVCICNSWNRILVSSRRYCSGQYRACRLSLFKRNSFFCNLTSFCNLSRKWDICLNVTPHCLSSKAFSYDNRQKQFLLSCSKMLTCNAFKKYFSNPYS